MSVLSPVVALAVTVVVAASSSRSWARTRSAASTVFLVEPFNGAQRPDRARPQGHAAHPLLAGPGALLPRQRLEHRRRGAVPPRRHRRRRARARGSPSTSVAVSRWVFFPLRRSWPARWRARSGRHRRVPQDRFNANEILVSLMLVYVAEPLPLLARVRALEGPRGLQLPADHELRRADRHAPRHPRACGCTGGSRWRSLAAVRDVDLHVPDLRGACSSRWAGRPRRRRATPGSRRAGRSGRPSSSRAALAGVAGALRGGGAHGPAHPARLAGLRLHGHHRGLRGAAQPAGLRAGRAPPGHVLHRRRAGAVAARTARPP